VLDGVALAEAITEVARQKFAHFDNLSFVTASARNSGGDVFVIEK
jgi:hypothetical protein